MQVTSQVLEEQSGIPMQLPADLFERLGSPGEFGDEQLGILADVMTTSRYCGSRRSLRGSRSKWKVGMRTLLGAGGLQLADLELYLETHYRFEFAAEYRRESVSGEEAGKDPLANIGETKERVDRLREKYRADAERAELRYQPAEWAAGYAELHHTGVSGV